MARDDLRTARTGLRRSVQRLKLASSLCSLGQQRSVWYFWLGAQEKTQQKIMKECVSEKTSLKEDEGALNTYKKPPESRGIGECFCVVPGHTSVFRTYGAAFREDSTCCLQKKKPLLSNLRHKSRSTNNSVNLVYQIQFYFGDPKKFQPLLPKRKRLSHYTLNCLIEVIRLNLT